MWEFDWRLQCGEKLPKKKHSSNELHGRKMAIKRHYEMLDDDGFENFDWILEMPCVTRTNSTPDLVSRV